MPAEDHDVNSINNNKETDARVTHSSEEEKITSSTNKLLEMSSIEIFHSQMKQSDKTHNPKIQNKQTICSLKRKRKIQWW